MFDYLEHYWETTGKPDEVGVILGELSLWNAEDGKRPMSGSIFPKWIACANKVLTKEQTDEGYRNADIKLG